METIKLHIDNITGEVYYSPNNEIETTIIEVVEVPEIEVKPLYTGKLYYIDGAFTTLFEVDANQVYGARNGCIEKLASTDYQVLKMMECQATGEALPYAASIYTDRQALRDRIAVLEGLLTP